MGLINARLIWSICERDYIVDNGEMLYKWANKIVGSTLTNGIMNNTMGKQFTAGNDTEDLRKTILRLNSTGFGTMIDY